MNKASVTLSFYGAARTVTGSRYLLTSGESRILIDCGLFQGYKFLREKNREAFPVPPESIQSVFLTHAHLDHCGYLPVLVKSGFHGDIICTQATYELCKILLLDSAKIQSEEAYYHNKHRTSKHSPAAPLYTIEQAKHTLTLFKPLAEQRGGDGSIALYTRYKKGDLSVAFHPNGHILGSTFLEVILAGKRLLFSGDLGRPHDLLMRAPDPPCACDYLIMESTYGDRLHDHRDLKATVADIINTCILRGGNLLIPSFAVGRSQVILYLLQQLRASGDIPYLPIYLDSPMAISATELLQQHHRLHRLTPEQSSELSRDIFMTRSADQSIALNNLSSPHIILSASGMATGGRVLHHLKRMLGDEKNTVMFAGYQVGGTRGARLVEGEDKIKIHGHFYPVAATIESLDFMSAHADQAELLSWLKKIPVAPKRCFITHGEPRAADHLRSALNEELGWPAEVVELGQTVYLN